MKIDSYLSLGLIFLALAFFLKLLFPFDVYILKSFNSAMFSELFFKNFTEIGNGLICLAVIVPVLSLSLIHI